MAVFPARPGQGKGHQAWKLLPAALRRRLLITSKRTGYLKSAGLQSLAYNLTRRHQQSLQPRLPVKGPNRLGFRGNSVTSLTFSTVQVCALQWNPHERELLSSHGFSQNQLCLWKYPSMVKMAEFTGHTARVLHLARVRVMCFNLCCSHCSPG